MPDDGVADYHTYFVGSEEWGFSVWAHNEYGPGVEKNLSRRFREASKATGVNDPALLEHIVRQGDAVNVNGNGWAAHWTKKNIQDLLSMPAEQRAARVAELSQQQGLPLRTAREAAQGFPNRKRWQGPIQLTEIQNSFFRPTQQTEKQQDTIRPGEPIRRKEIGKRWIFL